jgi:NAD+ kinase
MATVTFLVHPERADALALATDTAAWLTERGDAARILQFSGPDRVREAGAEAALADVDLAGTTVAVSMGGDGTFLRVVRLATGADVPVLGVNFGRLGYLPDLLPDQVRDALTKVFEGRAAIEERCALEVAISDRSRGDGSLGDGVRDATGAAGDATGAAVGDATVGGVTTLLALNEVVIERIDFGHTVRLATAIDGEEAITYSADGLIVATPTGSTAYNLSAGGPILAPTLRAMVVTPVAPHFSLDRSLVLTDAQEVTVAVAPDRAGVLVIDGTETGRLEPGATITCKVAARPVRVVRNEPQTFGGILRFRLLAERSR